MNKYIGVKPKLLQLGQTFLDTDRAIELFQECAYIVELDKILVPMGELLGKHEFNHAYKGFTFVMDNQNEKTTANAWNYFMNNQLVAFPYAHNVYSNLDDEFFTFVADGERVLVNRARLYCGTNPIWRLVDSRPLPESKP